MRNRAFLSSVAALLLNVAGIAQAQDFTRARALIREQITGQSVPSIAVSVARDGKFLWEEGFGWADRERRIAATEHTMYSLASISKPITATGLMVLVEKKQIDLDQPRNQKSPARDFRHDAPSVAESLLPATSRRICCMLPGKPRARPSL